MYRGVLCLVYEDDSIGSLVVDIRSSDPPADLNLPEDYNESVVIGTVDEGAVAFMLAFPCAVKGQDGPSFLDTLEFGLVIADAAGIAAEHAEHIAIMTGAIAYDEQSRSVAYPLDVGLALRDAVVRFFKDNSVHPDTCTRVLTMLKERYDV